MKAMWSNVEIIAKYTATMWKEYGYYGTFHFVNAVNTRLVCGNNMEPFFDINVHVTSCLLWAVVGGVHLSA